jgi:small-conductance mechanosensitive channel
MVRAAISRAVTLPLLVLLHLLFSLFSLALRITQSVSKTGAVIRQVSVPRHIALSLPSSSHRRGTNRIREKPGARLRERRALLETLKRAVRWAGEDGVTELSVYTDLGVFDLFRPGYADM